MSDIIEETVKMPIKGGNIEFRGKVDLVRGGTLIDWKTTADPQKYIDAQVVGYQAEMYALALQAQGRKLDRVVYRLIRKPTIKLSGKDATPIDYQDRCVEWLRKTPGALLEHEHYITDHKLGLALSKVEDTAWEIQQSRSRGYWRQNELACKDFMRRCPFVPLCSGCATPEDYDKREDRHEELGESGEGDTVTPSSIKCYNQCGARYYWQYEQRLKKRNEETSEALYTGDVFHFGIEQVARGMTIAEAVEVTREYGNAQPVIGASLERKQQQQTAQAAAMVVVAAEKWSV